MSTHRYVPWGPVLSSASGAPTLSLPPVAVRGCVRLPLKAQAGFDVIVDGVLQVPDADYVVVDRLVIFDRMPSGRRRGPLRRRQGAAVQIGYELDGHRLVAHGLEVEPL